MQQVAVAPGERTRSSGNRRPLAFLDTNVIIGYLRGDESAARLFSEEEQGRVGFAVNGIVLQELIFSGDAVNRPEFDHIRDRLHILPVHLERAEALVPRVRASEGRLPHSNDLLIVSSAGDCDYLVTRDVRLKDLVTGMKPQLVTPEELMTLLQAT